MNNDIELFVNLIFMTEYMNKLQDNNFREYLECANLTDDWSKFKDVNEILNLNNKDINNAIKEILQNERYVKKIKEDTNIDIEAIQI